ncbi:MAG: peptide deformylase [Proteobacteria bacterium]|nr:peptide deformylase [Pseudomonadota bacterium]RZO98466.1 MAG: peptide deformylase [Gammaproteobacteria bacterium]|tara:strand:+ start:328 stop:828 length:501 start_codon:yes stop_codon:yes gene_type:complete
MTIRKILTFPDPKLREVAKEVTEFNSDLKSLAEDLIETMYEFKGIGLAAVQIGVNKRVIVADVSEEKKEPFIFINPTIRILNEDEKGGYDEGCLSIPGFYEEVVRPTQVEISFQNLSGKKEEIIPEGLLGVVVQHETDHLDGKLMVDYISSVKRQRIRSKLLKLKR